MKLFWKLLELLGFISCAHKYNNWYIPDVMWEDRETGIQWQGKDNFQYRICSKCNHKDKEYV